MQNSIVSVEVTVELTQILSNVVLVATPNYVSSPQFNTMVTGR